MSEKYTLGIVGVRGYVGRELLGLLAQHDNIKVDWVSSRQLEGKLLSELIESDNDFQFGGLCKEHYYHSTQVENLNAEEVASKQTDIIVLALPNGLSKPFVDLLEDENSCKVIIDLSADYRFDKNWIYSVPELSQYKFHDKINGKKIIKISNPGCYATAMQIGLAPLVKYLTGAAHCFGTSGYSGAGTKPSDNNNPDKLKNNILPYGLIEHLHEKEVAYQLDIPISFSPSVAAFFRGISMIIQLDLKKNSQKINDSHKEDNLNNTNIVKLFTDYYNNQANIKITEAIPNIQQVIHTNTCVVGGFTFSEDGKRLTLVSCLDNLLKGAASQALQNICLALNIKKYE